MRTGGRVELLLLQFLFATKLIKRFEEREGREKERED